MNANELYSEVKKTMNPNEIDHHESDLYIKATSTADELVQKYDYRSQVTSFKEQTTGEKWYEIPFAYIPFWEEKCKTSN